MNSQGEIFFRTMKLQLKQNNCVIMENFSFIVHKTTLRIVYRPFRSSIFDGISVNPSKSHLSVQTFPIERVQLKNIIEL